MARITAFADAVRHRIRLPGRRFRRIAAASAAVCLLLLILMNLAVMRGGKAVYDSPESILPEYDTALVLGTSKNLPDGRANLYFQRRMAAAAELYHAGRVKRLIVSGDNRKRGYNEPADMRDSLISLGVPAEAISPDYAGFRTLDSVVRAKNVFGCERVLIVSQRFHCTRAVFIARARGLDAAGYAAADVSAPRWRLKMMVRECLARPWAWLDVYIFRRQPHFPQ